MVQAKNPAAARADLKPDLRLLISVLWESHVAASELGQEGCAFAMQLASLRSRGVSDSALRSLFHLGMVDHLHETTRRGQRRRSFRKVPNTAFTAASCFMLTAAGA